MCGLFGAIGKNINLGTVRALAIANMARGTDSTGFFNSEGNFVKTAEDALDALTQKPIRRFLQRAGVWFIAGHTRFATTGKVTRRNAHPFVYGGYIGSHNGCVDYPHDRNYQVDSEYLIDQLNRHSGDYQTAFEDISGYWVVTYYDGHHFYATSHQNECFFGRARDGVWYYSSKLAHLRACAGTLDNTIVLKKGDTIRFGPDVADLTNYELMPRFTSKAPVRCVWDKRATSGGKGGSSAGSGFLTFAGAKTDSAIKPLTVVAQVMPNDDVTAYGDALAKEAGYDDLSEFMGVLGFDDRIEALDYLEDKANADSKGGTYKFDGEAWAEYAGFDERMD